MTLDPNFGVHFKLAMNGGTADVDVPYYAGEMRFLNGDSTSDAF